ncbi:MAG: DUF1727 domain-containing protein [Acidimicrobiales bacterium]|nr:DUF1727 domain-containing protein [Acidimicrobiales bacterium]
MRHPAELIAHTAGVVSRRLGRGGGTSLPGMVLLRLHPTAAGRLARQLTRGSVAISATNGKTTTARLVRSMVDAAGWPTVANTAGANLLSGVTTALLAASRESPSPTFGLFEVDEAALPAVSRQLRPRVVVLMNLFRDQLDRFGELESLVERWRTMVDELDPSTVLVANADDPAVAALAMRHDRVVLFGVDAADVARAELSHAADSTHCTSCNAPLAYDLITIGHLGWWRCDNCGLARPTPDVTVRAVQLRGAEGITLTVATPRGDVSAQMALPGLHNAYNAAAAVAVAEALELDLDLLGPALGTADAAFGRAERVTCGDRDLVLLLAKNPTGANENVRTVLLDPDPLDVIVSLNDRTADGQDVSWIWDVDYEPLFERLHSLTVSGIRAHDLALRFRYGGFPTDRIVVEPDPGRALDTAIAAAPPGGRVYSLPSYTALLDLRAVLVDRGLVPAFWEDE